MKIDTSIKIKVNSGVYPPSEDSYLLIECIDVGKEKVLEIGTGTGIIALHAAKNGAVVTAVDKNQEAVKNAIENAEENGISVDIKQSDLFSNVDGMFNVIIFNPPYLPSDKMEEAWEGGEEGIEITKKFLEDAVHHLNPEGRIYIVLSTLGNIKKLVDEFRQLYSFKEIGRLSLFFEKLIVYKVTKKLSKGDGKS